MSDRLYLDCEFNGFGGELISMALVAEDGREWYCLLPEPRIWNEWVYDNVFPRLNDPAPTAIAADRESFRASLRWFLGQFDNPTIVADWYTDLVHFFGSFAGRDHTQSIDYPCRVELVTTVPNYAPEVPHNALSDARAIRDALSAPGSQAMDAASAGPFPSGGSLASSAGTEGEVDRQPIQGGHEAFAALGGGTSIRNPTPEAS